MDLPTFTPVLLYKKKFKNIQYCEACKYNKYRVCIRRNKKIAFSANYETEAEAIKARDLVRDFLDKEEAHDPTKIFSTPTKGRCLLLD